MFSGALVAGQPHRDYLIQLGMTPNRIFDGYDVVDNDFFSLGADAARKHAAEERVRLALPKPFFLSCCRFIPEKNLMRLLDAYKMYRDLPEAAAWDLVLVGDGPLRSQLAQWVSQHDLQDFIHMPGFIQYENLPAYYGLAEAFILPSISETWGLAVNEAMAAGLPVLVSKACGCSSDLVATDRTGYTFDPDRADELVKLMTLVASDHRARQDIGKAARGAIAEWSPARYGKNLRRVTQVALGTNQRHRLADELLIRALMLYPERPV
jgi:glycosyltransferase involved in cell wall biosynthesis